jgi:serine-type D-Ala-D-Ala carboxypeptidase (penicillin-binding protein 5/6)
MTQLGPTPRQHRRHRRRSVAGIVSCVLLLVFATAAALTVRTRDADSRRAYLSTDGWPERGQGAYQLGGGRPAASPDQHPVPIASLAKVMTALVVVRHLPLTADGPVLVVSVEDVADTARRAGRDESVVAVRAGERLTERQALMALLLPSANNVAVMLARYVSGSADAFVDEMNATAASLGMTRTTYTDPSGYDPATVSTAVDQLILARRVAADDTLAAMMSTARYRLPVAGTVANTDTLLGQDGFVGMKTGSHDAAGGCFMFRAHRSVAGVDTELIGVVLGQRGDSLIDAGLYAARQLADRIAPGHP